MQSIKPFNSFLNEQYNPQIPQGDEGETLIDFVQSPSGAFYEGEINGVLHEIRPVNHIVGDRIFIYKVPEPSADDYGREREMTIPMRGSREEARDAMVGIIQRINSDRSVFVVELTDLQSLY